MFDSTKYSGTCKAPFLLKDETHCISRLSSSETASTTLDITRGTKSLEMVNTWFLWKKNHEHNSYNRNVFYNNISVKSIDWKDHFIVINGQKSLRTTGIWWISFDATLCFDQSPVNSNVSYMICDNNNFLAMPKSSWTSKCLLSWWMQVLRWLYIDCCSVDSTFHSGLCDWLTQLQIQPLFTHVFCFFF